MLHSNTFDQLRIGLPRWTKGCSWSISAAVVPEEATWSSKHSMSGRAYRMRSSEVSLESWCMLTRTVSASFISVPQLTACWSLGHRPPGCQNKNVTMAIITHHNGNNQVGPWSPKAKFAWTKRVYLHSRWPRLLTNKYGLKFETDPAVDYHIRIGKQLPDLNLNSFQYHHQVITPTKILRKHKIN